MSIVFEVREPSGVEPTLVVVDGARERVVSTVAEVRSLVAEASTGLTVAQHHGLGLFAAVLAFYEYSDRFRPDEIGKVLDSIYFPTGSPAAGQAFSRGLGEGLLDLRRAGDLDTAMAEIIARAALDLRGSAEPSH